jgi:NTE family protein
VQGDIANIDTSAQPIAADVASEQAKAAAALKEKYGQVVLVLQGGGALGAYQVGVYQALHEAGIEPDWVIGTSIGAINGAIIAGNPLAARLDRLNAFWTRVEQSPLIAFASQLPVLGAVLPNWSTLTAGVSGFFRPNPLAFLGLNVPLSADGAGYYSTQPLAETLSELIDIAEINAGRTRLSIGAANLRSSEMRYFDSRNGPLSVKHVLASGALPPAFPPVRVDGELYWDGGILSNTPVEAVFDGKPRRNSLVFVVHLWNPQGPEPETMQQVMHRHKELQYSSRSMSHILRQRQIHRLRHIVAELAARLPEAERAAPEIAEMAAYGCLTRMHVVRLLAPIIEGEDHTKDIDFSASGIRRRREAGHAHGRRVLDAEPWKGDFDPHEGFILHEVPSVDAAM